MRLFLALELPSAVRAGLSAVELDAGWRKVPVESLHVTLAFLGSQEAVEPVVEALPATLPPVGELRLHRLVRLPPRRPRVLAVELEDRSGACGALQATVSQALEAAGLYEPEHRRWLAHVTIGRARGPVDRRAPLPALEPVAFAPGPVTLFESRLGRGPAVYEPRQHWDVSRVD